MFSPLAIFPKLSPVTNRERKMQGGQKQLFYLNNWQNEHLLTKNPASKTGEVPYTKNTLSTRSEYINKFI